MDRPAGFWIRFGARLIDALMLSAIIYVLIALFNLDTGATEVQTSESLISIIYFTFLPVIWLGYTAGKRALGMRIVRMDGSDVKIMTMLKREFVTGFLYGITFGILLIASLFTVVLREDKRAVHDLIAGTYVTYDKPE